MEIGLQLYSVRNSMQRDPKATLTAVAQAGYKYVETATHDAGHGFDSGIDLPEAELKALLEQLGLKVVSAHIFPLDDERLPEIFRFQKSLCNNTVTVPMEFFRDRDEVLKCAAKLEHVGAVCAENGMRLLYHNHFYEFRKYGDETALDLLMANTDPAHVGMELDAFWAWRGGIDPVALIKKHGARIHLVHVKDLNKACKANFNILDGVSAQDYIDMDYFMKLVDPDSFIEMGDGCVDYSAILAALREHSAAEYLILEQDHTKLSETESVKRSFANLKKLV